MGSSQFVLRNKLLVIGKKLEIDTNRLSEILYCKVAIYQAFKCEPTITHRFGNIKNAEDVFPDIYEPEIHQLTMDELIVTLDGDYGTRNFKISNILNMIMIYDLDNRIKVSELWFKPNSPDTIYRTLSTIIINMYDV